MQKFILIRGHQGSGKSTFAEQKAAEFKAQYPDAEVVRIENDLFITDEYGEYRWSGEAVDKAQKRGNALMTETLRLGRQNPNRNILIINKKLHVAVIYWIGRRKAVLKQKFIDCTISIPTCTV